MEEIQEKLAILMKSAAQKKTKLNELKAIKSREKYFQMNYKWKFLIAVVISWLIYARFCHLLDSKGVRPSF
jgi:hypothetical protein